MSQFKGGANAPEPERPRAADWLCGGSNSLTPGPAAGPEAGGKEEKELTRGAVSAYFSLTGPREVLI